MSKPSEVKAVSQAIVKVIPLVMRTLAAGQRRSSYPMPTAHMRLLNILAHHSCNLSELAVRQAVSLPTISNSISVLVERGWVKRVRSPDDRRQVMLELTPDGREMLAEFKSHAEARVAELLSQLSPDELKSLAAGISILEQALSPVMCPKLKSLAQDRVKRASRE
jgi:DNA-binding MarR family transcriptional regulator